MQASSAKVSTHAIDKSLWFRKSSNWMAFCRMLGYFHKVAEILYNNLKHNILMTMQSVTILCIEEIMWLLKYSNINWLNIYIRAKDQRIEL